MVAPLRSQRLPEREAWTRKPVMTQEVTGEIKTSLNIYQYGHGYVSDGISVLQNAAVDWISCPQIHNPPRDGVWRWGPWEVIQFR